MIPSNNLPCHNSTIMDDAKRDLAKRVEQLTLEEEELKKEDKRREEPVCQRQINPNGKRTGMRLSN